MGTFYSSESACSFCSTLVLISALSREWLEISNRSPSRKIWTRCSVRPHRNSWTQRLNLTCLWRSLSYIRARTWGLCAIRKQYRFLKLEVMSIRTKWNAASAGKLSWWPMRSLTARKTTCSTHGAMRTERWILMEMMTRSPQCRTNARHVANKWTSLWINNSLLALTLKTTGTHSTAPGTESLMQEYRYYF